MGGLLLIGLAIAASGCSTGITLTSAGERVRHIQAADTPIGCNLLGDVAIGIPPARIAPLLRGLRRRSGSPPGPFFDSFFAS